MKKEKKEKKKEKKEKKKKKEKKEKKKKKKKEKERKRRQHLVKDLLEAQPLVRRLRPAPLHQLDAFGWSEVRAHRGAEQRGRPAQLLHDLWNTGGGTSDEGEGGGAHLWLTCGGHVHHAVRRSSHHHLLHDDGEAEHVSGQRAAELGRRTPQELRGGPQQL